MRISFFLAVFLHISSCGDDNGKVVEYYPTGEKFAEGYLREGKSDGHWLTWYENGQIRQVGFYKNGKEEGAWKAYNEDGSIASLSYYQHGDSVGHKCIHSRPWKSAKNDKPMDGTVIQTSN